MTDRDPGSIRVGPAGWSYEDWKGIVYPHKTPRSFDPLAYLCRYFDTIEVNSPFYHPPSADTVRSWLARVGDHASFRFTIKLWRRFTHERAGWSERDVAGFLRILEPLVRSGRLGALLIQFPWSFKNDADNRRYLMDLLDRFEGIPRVLEVRHASWARAEIHEELRTHGTGFCNIDQPLFDGSLPPGSEVTSPLGYVRLHGQNHESWFRKDADRDERYDYLYSESELGTWAERIRSVARRARETYVITNNHFRGQAVVNAIELMNIIGKTRVAVPPPLLLEYPRLGRIKKPEPGQIDLFGG